LFFVLFWAFSIGLYAHLSQSFKEGYATKVTERVRHEINKSGSYQAVTDFSIQHTNAFLNKSAEVTLENFRVGLILVNLILLFGIPLTCWLLVKKTLLPIREVMQKHKQFVSDASHELLTPLTIVANEIELALKQKRESSYYVSTLETLKGEISRLSTLVNNLLILARHEGTSQSISMQEVELADVVSKVVSALARKFADKKVRYNINFPEENIVVKGNATMLEQLFTNLIDNAFKFSLTDKSIEISIQKKRQLAEISIQDEGIGIAKDEQEKIFDRFYRVDTSRTKSQGYGLGLSLAKTIAELHAGNITLHSAPGEGSTFTVILPVAR
jgi:signal transduction histidine kinase